MRILLVGAGDGRVEELARSLTTLSTVEIELVADSQAALELLPVHTFDAVVCYLEPGAADRLELVRRVRLRRPRLPLVILTPDATVDHAVAAMRAGATDFLPANVGAGPLLNLLRQAVGQRASPEHRDGSEAPSANGGGTSREPERASAPPDGGSLVFPGTWDASEPDRSPEPTGVLMPPGLTLAEVERRYLEATLQAFEGDYSSLAAQLGISRKTLWDKRRRLALDRKGERTPAEPRSA